MKRMVVGLGVLAGLTLAPANARADEFRSPTFIENYGNIFGAERDPLLLPRDDLGGSRFTGKPEAPNKSLSFVPFVNNSDDTSGWGLGFGFQNRVNYRRPWEISASYSSLSLDNGGPNFDGFSAIPKYTVFSYKRLNDLKAEDTDWDMITDVEREKRIRERWSKVPSIRSASLVTNFRHVETLGDRMEVLVAYNQRIGDEKLKLEDGWKAKYLTINLGYGHKDAAGSPAESGFVSGIGFTLPIRQFLSLSADYKPKSSIDTEDTWSMSALFAINSEFTATVGAGKHGAVFGRLVSTRAFR